MKLAPPNTTLSLSELQHWFADSLLHNPSDTYIRSGSMEIYRQQYWARLLSILRECFPLLVHTTPDFDENIGIPYLQSYPPSSWDLSRLGEHMTQFLPHSRAAKIDWAFEESFTAPSLPPLSGDPHELLDASICLQPYVRLLDHVIIVRDHWRRLAPGETTILSAIQNGSTLRQAVELLDDAPDLAYWVQDWILRGWLCQARAI